MTGVESGGAIRVSVGLASTFDDVERFVAFPEITHRDRLADVSALPARLRG